MILEENDLKKQNGEYKTVIRSRKSEREEGRDHLTFGGFMSVQLQEGGDINGSST
jgi:hypothetical protein